MIERAVILSSGDELTTGRTVDTNANFIADKLVAAGLDVVAVVVVGDYHERIAWAWREAMRQADVIIGTGGLGPTADDLTTEVLAQVAGRTLKMDTGVADRIRQMFAAMGRVMPENNLKQAMFPEGATVIPNPLGTAPGFRLDLDTEWGRRHLIVLPGVPREMKPMIEEQVLPWIEQERGGEDVYRSHTFQTFGISESALDELVTGCVAAEEGRIAFRAAFPQISVRLTVHGRPDATARNLPLLAARLRERIGTYAYGEGDTSMEEVVGTMLKQRGLTIALAESCTGGLIGHRITNVPGSSAYFVGDLVTYSNSAKQQLLGVNAATLERVGAVSEEVATEMAEGARRVAGADFGLATTGIAGPDGGSAEKPVGTVCIALATAEKSFVRRYQFWGTRDWVKILTSQVALDWVRRHLLGLDPSESGVLRR
ncbi:MAG: competence/damage-inducible protein A [Deltaproteobacteria bacterium]|nr:competence/damage-inducible protein A [Deltaproteobacteria bacterium]MBI3390719.1 competence/damage-inducible protein A [Deltaproteobacteria bacterium]